MKSTQSQKSLHGQHQTQTSLASTTAGELKVRQLQYFKTKSMMERPFTQGKLSVTSHKLTKGRGLQQIVVEEIPQFFENFISVQQLHTEGIPNEETIKRTFRFKLPCIVEQHENNQSSIHFLEGFTHSQTLIESYIAECQGRLVRAKRDAQQLRAEMKAKQESTNAELDEFVVLFRKQNYRLQRILREDYVAHQSEQFRLNKSITILTRDKQQMEVEVMQHQQGIYKLEMRLQGVECFDLHTDDALLRSITQNNMRPDKSQYSFKSIIH